MRPKLSIGRYFLLATYGTCFCSLALASVADVFSLLAKILVVLIIAVTLLSEMRLPTSWQKPLVFWTGWLGIVWSLSQVVLNKDVVFLGDSLALLMVMNLGMIKKKARYWTVIVSALLLCFSGLVLEPGVIGYLLFIGFLISASVSLNAANLHLALKDQLGERFQLDSSYFLTMLRAVPFGIFVAVCVFILFPRINRLALEMPFAVKQRYKTGYNGSINLNAQGAIGEDEEVVLHVSSSDNNWLYKNAANLYLRGTTLDSFEANRWRKESSIIQAYSLFQPIATRRKLDKKTNVKLTITTEPLHNNVIFLPDATWSIRSISQSVGQLRFDAMDGSLFRDSDSPLRYQYTVQLYPDHQIPNYTIDEIKQKLSDESVPTDRRPFEIDIRRDQELFTLGQDVVDSAVINRWLTSIPFGSSSGIGQLLSTLRRHFRQNYQASLLNSYTGSNSFESFLTVDKVGHCEFFSTAAVLYLRSHGIPSRVVTGYRGGQFNDIAGAVIVKQKSAHAWVEYFIPEHGWQLFDPTPAISLASENTLLSEFNRFLQAGNYFLNQYLVDYNLLTQRDLVSSLRKSLSRSKGNKPFDWKQNLGYPIAGLAIMYLIFRYWRRSQRFQNRHYPTFYIKFLERCEKSSQNGQKQASETFSGFHSRMHELKVIDQATAENMTMVMNEYIFNPLADKKELESSGRRILEELISHDETK